MTGRRRSWRWVVTVWVIAVVVAGALTLWLQDSAQPPGPNRWENADPSPSLPEGRESACASVTPDENGRIACLVVTTR
ncbi:hypothetical protein AB0C70_07340 [Streptomyces sp. NPDC048564]|uniref:hypothetical protein n=1 Tax=unclassified Streptomyces TaxID=2593676 RepID=UPI0033D2B6B5